MRKIATFALSFAAAFFIFVAVAAAVLLFSGKIGTVLDGFFSNSEEKGQTDTRIPDNAEEVSVKNAKLLIMLETNDKLYLSVAELMSDGDGTEVSVRQCFAEEECERLYKELNKSGIYVFSDSVTSTLGLVGVRFIKFDEESFAKTTDRLKGVVYNEKDRRLLLTGSQAVGMADSISFAEFCEQLLKKALSKNTEEEFLNVANITVNDLSYPLFYEFYSR